MLFRSGGREEMKKLESSLKNMVIVLTGVTVVAGALLGYVNELTKDPIAPVSYTHLTAMHSRAKKSWLMFSTRKLLLTEWVRCV